MLNWAYLAGFLDGDGWITISRGKNGKISKYIAAICQSIKEKEKMLKIFNFIQNNNIHCTFIERNNQSMINITISEQRSIVKFLKNIIPFLLIKKNKAIKAINYTKNKLIKRGIKYLYQKRKKKYWRMREIKKLIKLLKLGYSNNAIALILKRNTDSIGHKLYRLNLKRND
jgi:predicted transglutaminase-like cysteine proteinase